MFPTNSYQLYDAAEQHLADLRAASEAAARLRDLRLRIRRIMPSGR